MYLRPLSSIARWLILAVLMILHIPSHAIGTLRSLEEWEKDIKSYLPDNVQRSIELSDSLLIYGNEINDDEYISKGYYFLGVANYYLGRNYLSNEYYKKALKTSFAANDIDFRGRCWNNMGINYEMIDNTEKSIDAYLKSLRISEKLNDSLGIAQTWINIGLLDIKVANYDRANIYLRKALKYFERQKDSLNIGLCYQNLGISSERRGMLDSALVYYKESLGYFDAINNTFGIIQNNYNIGICYLDMGNRPTAMLYLEKSIELSQEIGVENIVANAYLHLAINHSDDLTKKLKYTQMAHEIFEKLGDEEQSLTSMLLLCDLYAHAGDMSNYDRTMEMYKKRMAELTMKNTAQNYEEFQIIYETEVKQNIIQEQGRKLERRNTWLVLAAITIVLLIAFVYIVTHLLLKMRKYVRALYKKNIDLQKANVISISPQSTDKNESSETEHLPNASATDKKVLENVTNKMTDLYQEIINLFEREKIYLKHDLSVSELSARLNTNDKYISVAINNNSSSNFNNLVNAFRINEAKSLIAAYGKSINIKELCDRSGFKSLNTFYKNFKENTGLTPSQYIELSEDKELNQ